MSVEQYKLAWEADIPEGEKIILLRLADFADPDGDRVYPSIGRIAHDTGFAERHVQRVLKKFKTLGVIQENGWSEYGTKVLSLHIEVFPKRKPYDKRPSDWRPSDRNGVTFQADGVTFQAERGDLDVTLSVSRPVSIEPLERDSIQEIRQEANGRAVDTLGANPSPRPPVPLAPLPPSEGISGEEYLSRLRSDHKHQEYLLAEYHRLTQKEDDYD